MDLQAEKYTLIEELMKVTDVNLVREIKSILQGSNQVVGYRPDGTPITKTRLQSDILEAKRQIESGEYTTQEDLEKESETW